MKKNCIYIFVSLLSIVLGLSSCSSQKQELTGTYRDVCDETHYLSFNEDGSFIDNFLNTISEGKTSVSDCYIYKINDSGLITVIDTTEYEGQDTLDEYELGWLYNDSIGIWLDGTLPINETQTSISCSLNGYGFEFQFDSDNKTYRHTTILESEIMSTENGTYAVEGNKIVCTNEDGVIRTFINAEDKVFSIDYIKE